MISELLRHSDKPETCELIPESLRLCHRPRTVTRDDALVPSLSRATAPPPPRAEAMSDLFESGGAWALGPLEAVSLENFDQQGDEHLELDLAGF